MTTYLRCPICGGTERSLLPESVCDECGCGMKPVADAEIALNKDASRDDRIAAMRRLGAAPAPAVEREVVRHPTCHKCGRTVHEVGRVVRANPVGEMPAVWECPGVCITPPTEARDHGAGTWFPKERTPAINAVLDDYCIDDEEGRIAIWEALHNAAREPVGDAE